MTAVKSKLLIVDGYNVLRSGKRYRSISEPDYTDDAFNRARETLINDCICFAGRTWRTIIIFDGAKNKYSEGTVETVGGVQIMFSPAGQSADKVIERLARDAREKKLETLVVTSDATIQDTVFGGGVDRMSANDFSWEIEALHAEDKLDSCPKVVFKNTMAERLDAKTRANLEALRDGIAVKKKSIP